MESRTVGRFMNLKTDFAFKTVLANEKEKALLINLLNEIFRGRNRIMDIRYLQPEQFGKTEADRRAIFDIHCTNEKNEQFIIEMQVIQQKFVIDRCLYYSTFPIQKQAVKGRWNYELQPVYVIALMDFILWQDNPFCINYHSIMNEKTDEKTSDKLQFITVELPKFRKTEAELENDLDNWLYCFQHIHELNEQPQKIQGEIFNKLFKMMEIEELTQKNKELYSKSVFEDYDVQLGMEYAAEVAFERGNIVGKYQIAQEMKRLNFADELIFQLTGLTKEQIQ